MHLRGCDDTGTCADGADSADSELGVNDWSMPVKIGE